MGVPQDKINERIILLGRMFSDYTNTILKIGKELNDDYCIRFNDEGYDSQYNRFDSKEVLRKVASIITDQQLSYFAQKYNDVYDYPRPFLGMYYTYDEKKRNLSLASSWDKLRSQLNELHKKHGKTLLVVLDACYATNLEQSHWDNYLKIQYYAKDMNAKGWRHALTDLENSGIIWRHKGDVAIPKELMPLIREVIEHRSASLSDNLEIDGKTRVKVADAFYEYFSEQHNYNGRINPLPEEIHAFFGERLISYRPVDPQKKIRDFVDGLSTQDLLKFLAHITKGRDKLQEEINDHLKTVGVRVQQGSVISLTEMELKLTAEERIFTSKLDALGLADQRQLVELGIKYLREGKLREASSNICLAFDSVLKKCLSSKGVTLPERISLGKLIEKGVEAGIIEQHARTLFDGFVAIRNLEPQHSGSKGEVNRLTDHLTFLLAYVGRDLIGYLLERFTAKIS